MRPPPPHHRRRLAEDGLRLAVLIGAFTALSTPGFCLEPPPADSAAAAAVRVGAALDRFDRLPVSPLGEEVARARAACAMIPGTGDVCDPVPVRRCQAALATLFDRARDVLPRVDDLRGAALSIARAELGNAISRLTLLRGHTAVCEAARSPVGDHMASLTPAPDAAYVAIEPLIPLRAGRRYWIVVEGRPSRWLDETPSTPSLVPTTETRAAQTGFPRTLGGIDTDRVEGLLASMVRTRGPETPVPGFGSVRLHLPQPLRGDDLLELRASFVPARGERPAHAIGAIEVADGRPPLRADRRRLRSQPCPGPRAGLEPASAPPGVPMGTAAFRGRYRSLDVGTEDESSRAPGRPGGDAPALDLEFRLLLPPDFTPRTPLVLAVDGHRGSHLRILQRHAPGLLAAGLAVVAIDLPFHGGRARDGRDFVTTFDPSRLALHMRQATTDVMALVRHAVECGFPIAPDLLYRPRLVRFLGYSLGAMVGAIARSVEPDLGTTTLLAPGGDLMGWLKLRLVPELGAQFVTCIGGPEHGKTCFKDGRCAPPGTCGPDPYLELLFLRIAPYYALASSSGDPLSFATERTGFASKAPLLLITGGEDAALHPDLATRLTDAYAMRPAGPSERRGPNSRYTQWPTLAHDLPDHEAPRRQAHHFLATDGRRAGKNALSGGTPGR